MVSGVISTLIGVVTSSGMVAPVAFVTSISSGRGEPGTCFGSTPGFLGILTCHIKGKNVLKNAPLLSGFLIDLLSARRDLSSNFGFSLCGPFVR